jgi:hypothetical protein
LASNPAARLFSLINEASRSPVRPNRITRQAWAQVLGADPNSSEFLLRFVGLTELLDKTKQQIMQLNIGTTEISQLEVLRKALNPGFLDTAWDQNVKRFSPTATVYLSTCADILGKFMPEREIPGETLKELQQELEELQHRILESEHETALKTFLLRQIEKARVAIFQYRLHGIKPLEDAVESVLGAMLVPPGDIETKEARETEDFISFWSWIGRTAQLIGLGEKVEQLSSSIPPGLLGSG